MFGEVAEDVFGIGVTKDFFYSRGIRPEWRDRSRRLVTEGVMLLTVDLSILADIPLGPVGFEISGEDKRE